MPGKVLAAHLRDDGFMDGCNHYRFRIPFEELRKHGGVYDWAPIGVIRDWAKSKSPVRPTDYDLWLLPRYRPTPYLEDEAKPEILDAAEKHLGITLERKSYFLDLVRIMKGKIAMVLEYDDDYFTESRDLGYEHTDLLLQMAREVDAVTVSTPYLKELVQKVAPGQRVYVLPNCVAWHEWQGWDRWDLWPKDHVVIALTGSHTHQEDWRVLETVLPRIMVEHGNAVFLGAGYLPDYLEDLVKRYPDRASFVPFADYTNGYAHLIRQADIVLCPLIPDDPFNWAKSEIKAVEGMAAGRLFPGGKNGGAVPITSDVYFYRRATGGNKRGLTIEHTPEAWYGAIERLIDDHDLRMRLARRAWTWAHDQRSIERKWSLWRDAYQEILRRKQ